MCTLIAEGQESVKASVIGFSLLPLISPDLSRIGMLWLTDVGRVWVGTMEWEERKEKEMRVN